MNQNVLPLGIVFSLLLTIPTPEIAQAVSIEMFPSKQAVAVGEAFQVDIVINGLGKMTAPSLSAFDLDLGFNNSVLKFDSAIFGGFVDLSGTGTKGFNNSQQGIVNFFEISLDSPETLNASQPSNFKLATLNFMGLSPGSSVLSLSVNDLTDENTNPLTLNTLPTDKSVQVIPVPESSFGLLSYLTTLGLGLVLTGKKLKVTLPLVADKER